MFRATVVALTVLFLAGCPGPNTADNGSATDGNHAPQRDKDTHAFITKAKADFTEYRRSLREKDLPKETGKRLEAEAREKMVSNVRENLKQRGYGSSEIADVLAEYGLE